MNIDPFHELNHEFERPICILLSFPSVQKSFNEITLLQKQMEDEVKALHEKYTPMLNKAAENLTEVVKGEGLWPYDYNEATDHLMIKNGVLFYARHPATP